MIESKESGMNMMDRVLWLMEIESTAAADAVFSFDGGDTILKMKLIF